MTNWLTRAKLSAMSESDHVGTAKAAALLGKSPATVKRMAKSGELPYLFKMDGETGAYVFSRAVLAAYLKAQVAA